MLKKCCVRPAFLAPLMDWKKKKKSCYNPVSGLHDAVPQHLHDINCDEHQLTVSWQWKRRQDKKKKFSSVRSLFFIPVYCYLYFSLLCSLSFFFNCLIYSIFFHVFWKCRWLLWLTDAETVSLFLCVSLAWLFIIFNFSSLKVKYLYPSWSLIIWNIFN